MKVTVKYELTNKGKSEFNSFFHLVSDAEQARLSYISASEENKDGKLRMLKADVKGLKKGFAAYKVRCSMVVIFF